MTKVYFGWFRHVGCAVMRSTGRQGLPGQRPCHDLQLIADP